MAKVKVRIGVVFSAKEVEVDVDGELSEILERVEGAISGGERTLTITSDKGKTVLVPVDKLAYAEIEDADKGGGIGFSR